MNSEIFRKLNEYKNDFAISLFIPTARTGKEVFNRTNEKDLKSQWDHVKREFESEETTQLDEIDKKINQLLENRDFWNNQLEGLAVFAGKDFFEYYRVPFSLNAGYRIAQSFYLLPIVPFFSSENLFYLLSLQLGEVSFFTGNEQVIHQVDIEGITPSQLEERVGFDYKEKNLQFRNMDDIHGTTQFHGHGGSERNTDAETKAYFSAIDQGLHDFLRDKTAPLVVVTNENLFPIYQEANTYTSLYKNPVTKNPADMSKEILHEEALKVLEDYFEQNRSQKMELYKESTPEKKTAVTHDIVPAAFEGKIDTLFVEDQAELWGEYDELSRELKLHDNQKENSVSLIDLTAKKVLENQGKVYLMNRAFMPEKDFKMNAVLRY